MRAPLMFPSVIEQINFRGEEEAAVNNILEFMPHRLVESRLVSKRDEEL